MLHASKDGEGMGRRGSIAAMTFALATSFLLPIEDVNADTCARKECQPKPNFLPGEKPWCDRYGVDGQIFISLTMCSLGCSALLSINSLTSPLTALTRAEGSLPDKSEIVSMPALKGKDYGKTKMKYPDFVATPSGLQYKDVKVGNGESPEDGDRVVFDWEGYTIGHYGRIFQAKNGVKGGAFADETGAPLCLSFPPCSLSTDFQRCILGSHTVVRHLLAAAVVHHTSSNFSSDSWP